jgi:hypothetical protein
MMQGLLSLYRSMCRSDILHSSVGLLLYSGFRAVGVFVSSTCQGCMAEE